MGGGAMGPNASETDVSERMSVPERKEAVDVQEAGEPHSTTPEARRPTTPLFLTSSPTAAKVHRRGRAARPIRAATRAGRGYETLVRGRGARGRAQGTEAGVQLTSSGSGGSTSNASTEVRPRTR